MKGTSGGSVAHEGFLQVDVCPKNEFCQAATPRSNLNMLFKSLDVDGEGGPGIEAMCLPQAALKFIIYMLGQTRNEAENKKHEWVWEKFNAMTCLL